MVVERQRSLEQWIHGNKRVFGIEGVLFMKFLLSRRNWWAERKWTTFEISRNRSLGFLHLLIDEHRQ